MERFIYSISIKATAAKIWEILFSDETFPIWSASFSEGNQVEGTWREGSELMILNKNREGVVYLVELNKPYSFMSLKQSGIFKDGKKHLNAPEVLEFAGGHENYTLDEQEDETVLRVEKDAISVQKVYFDHVFPRALEIVKSMAESEI